MSNNLMDQIKSPFATKAREQIDSELEIAITFAKLELAEVKAGIRSLCHCPGLDKIAKYIKKAKAAARAEL